MEINEEWLYRIEETDDYFVLDSINNDKVFKAHQRYGFKNLIPDDQIVMGYPVKKDLITNTYKMFSNYNDAIPCKINILIREI